MSLIIVADISTAPLASHFWPATKLMKLIYTDYLYYLDVQYTTM